ncbi:MAG: AI-2E family transporter [Epsilonproteobacteria bacterium]|nr:AI-2E family transporter [Campylobacterota bacterium]NPA56249.1 AI-2E family transporter [Campylobacterota bacterium]
MKPIHFLAFLFLIVGYFTYRLFSPYLETMTIAALLALATYKINKYFLTTLPGRVLPALLSTLILGAILFAPIIYIITNAASIVAYLDMESINRSFLFVKEWIREILDKSGAIDAPILKKTLASFDIKALVNSIVKVTTFLGAKSANFLKDTLLILIFYFFANLYGREILLYFQNLIPFSKEESKTIFESLAGVMGVVFNSIIATAVLEGALFGLITAYYGYNGILFGILYGFASLIPVVGGVIMWLPLSIDLYLKGKGGEALGLALYSILVISVVADTFVKPIIIRYIDNLMVANRGMRINELLIFFSLVAGLSSYGFWGMIIGPAVITLMISILQIYPQVAGRSFERCGEGVNSLKSSLSP